eukprot:5026096-Alexandrium_andersonii.AAC.1
MAAGRARAPTSRGTWPGHSFGMRPAVGRAQQSFLSTSPALSTPCCAPLCSRPSPVSYTHLTLPTICSV